jgi:thiol:disulfide interchange protein DsbD
MLVYGMLMLLGVAANSEDPLQPLRGAFARSGQETKQSGAGFVTVRSLPELDARLAEARAAGRWVMLDYYADWCVSCKEMERYTFADPRVATALSDLTLVQADVTANGPAEQALLGRFGLVGPPATLFFGPDGSERAGHRIIGYMGPDEFLQHIREVAGRAR